MINCKHTHRLFIQAGRVVSSLEHSRNRVKLCADCGTFFISGMMNEQYYRITFDLVTQEQLEAAKKAVDYYSS